MPKHDQPARRRRREPSLRRAREPRHLQELELAAQTDVDTDAESAGQPLEDEAHAAIAFASREPDQLPVDTGLSIDPEDLGLQFLRDATEQDNFETEFPPEAPTAPGAPPELLAEGFDAEEERPEVFLEDVDLLSNVIHEASLFDALTEQDETRSPRIESDETEPGATDLEARAREQERERRALRRLRFSRRGRASRG